MGDPDRDEPLPRDEGEGGDADADAEASPPQPDHGEVHVYTDHAALIRRFRAIGDPGGLVNASPAAMRTRIGDNRPDQVPTPLEAFGRAIMGIETAPAHFIYLIERAATWRAVLIGFGMVRRASEPDGGMDAGRQRADYDDALRELELRHAVHTRTSPRRVRGISGRPGEAGAGAVGMALDYLASIGIAMSERMHHAVVIRRPPATLVRSAPGSEAPYHFVLWRPLQGNLRLGDWQMAPADHAIDYLERGE